jgi:hypothetical protein
MSKKLETGVTQPVSKPRMHVIHHDPALRLQDFRREAPLRDTGAVEWLIGERERNAPIRSIRDRA